MVFDVLDVLAAIVIFAGIIKLIFLVVSPKTWFNFARKVHLRPKVTSLVALVLAAVVLYYLINAGMTIIHIFAVMLFVSLIAVIGISMYADNVIKFYLKKGPEAIFKEQWLLALVWVLLTVWGLIALFS